MSNPAPTFYIFHGTDEFTCAETIDDLRQRLATPDMAELNTTRLDGRRVTLSELRHSCQAVPFLAERRLIIVTGLLTRLGKQESSYLNGLLQLLPNLPETTRLILVEQKALPADHPVLKLAKREKRGYVRQFEPPSDGALPNWIIDRARKREGQITREAAARLAQVIGSDLRLLDQEIVKLVTYAGSDAEITLEDVTRLVPYVQEAVIFDLVDALGRRESKAATSTLQRLIENGEHPLGILGMIVRQFRLLIQIKELRQAGENSSSVARILGIHPYPARKVYRQTLNFTAPQLERIYRHLLETDAQIKSGELNPETALDLLVAGLTQ